MTPDYPAAHSMDTVWFAVDDDGHVAQFDSGEDGAVPLFAVPFGQDGDAIRQPLINQAAEVIWDRLQQAPSRHLNDLPRDFDVPVDCFVFVDPSALQVAQFLFKSHRGWPVHTFTREGRHMAALFFAPFLKDEFAAGLAAMHKRGLCKGCFQGSNPQVSFDDNTPILNELGLFTYGCLNYGLPPYELNGKIPVKPFSFEQLPSESRAMLERCRLKGVRFAASPRVQPLELTTCATWGRDPGKRRPDEPEEVWTFLASDGKTRRPLPPPPPTRAAP